MPSDGRQGTLRLKRAARPLEPARDPFYVHNPVGARVPAGPGWYWTPAGAQAPEYLGHNSIEAEIRLRALVDAAKDPA